MNAKINTLIKNVGAFARRHRSEILIWTGSACFLGAIGFAIKATPVAMAKIEEEKAVQSANGHPVDRLKPLDVVRVTWKSYIPTAGAATLGLVCMACASTENAHRAAALATACTLSENALKEYQEKVIETVGEKKERLVRDAVSHEHVENTPLPSNGIIMTGQGSTLFLDMHSKRYFEFDIEKLRKVENDLNRRMRDDMYISLNDFYYELGLEPTEMGDQFGWNITSGYIDIYPSAQIAPNGRPCIVMNHTNPPKYDYMDY